MVFAWLAGLLLLCGELSLLGLGCVSLANLGRGWHLVSLLLQNGLTCLATLRSSDLRSECGWCPLQSLRNRFLPIHFMLQVILAIGAVTAALNTVEPAGEAFAVKLEAFRVSAVAAARRILFICQDCLCGLLQLFRVGEL